MSVVEHGDRRIELPRITALHLRYAWQCEPCDASWPGHHLLVVGGLPVPQRRRRGLDCPRCSWPCAPVLTSAAGGIDAHTEWTAPAYPELPRRDGHVDLDRLEAWQVAREAGLAALRRVGDTGGMAVFVAAIERDEHVLLTELGALLVGEARLVPLMEPQRPALMHYQVPDKEGSST